MRIILINQFFWPDSAATSQILTDMARHCASLDCDVTALCGMNGYAPHAEEAKPDVHIIRTRSFGFGRSRGARMASYLSFLSGSLWHGLRLRQPRAVLTLTTPPLLSVVGSILKAVRGSRHYIWEMDVYPDIATSLGVLRPGGVLARGTRYLANWSRRQADGIIVLGEEMKALLISHGVPAGKIHVCENWADGQEITPLPFSDGPLTIHYSGNLGLAHDTETIRTGMLHFRGHSNIRFIFDGSGSRRPPLEAFCREHDIRNVTFRPYSDRSQLSRNLAKGHLGLVTQLPQTLGCTVPSKTYGIMAAGRPLLYIGPKAATPARHIETYRCGWQIDPGDVSGLISLLHQLLKDRSAICELGRRAREAFEANFERQIGFDRIRRVLGLEVEVPPESSLATLDDDVSCCID